MPGEHFNTVLYDDGAGAKTGVGFQPDLVWVKSRGSTYEHEWTDSVRGVTKALSCNSTNAESTDTTGLTAFGADGFTVGADTNYSDTTGTGMVAWNLKAGGTAVANNTGSLPDGNVMVSANTTAGFSILTYTGTGNDETVGHGLSEEPELIWVFRRTDAGYFKIISTTAGSFDFTEYFRTDDTQDYRAGNYWQDADPSASIFSIEGIEGADNSTNGSSKEFVGYCWHSVEGYSKVGSYTGNSNTDGPFIYTGFKPAFIMVKLSTASSGQFAIFDNKRDPDNPTGLVIYENLTAIDTDVSSYTPYDILSNGFKSRIPGGNGNEANYNSTGQTYIYLAFAESPFKYSNAR